MFRRIHSVLQFEILFSYVGDARADGKGCGCAGGGGVEDVNGAMALLDHKVVDQRATHRHRLGTYSGATRHQIALADFRQ